LKTPAFGKQAPTQIQLKIQTFRLASQKQTFLFLCQFINCRHHPLTFITILILNILNLNISY